MSLFSSISLASNSLHAAQIGLQVSGNNIANASTPGYLRQDVLLEAAPPQEIGNLNLGLGVSVTGIIQRVDYFLESRLRSATSDLQKGEAQESAYLQLESLIGELSDADLSTSLTKFFNSIHDVANQPESVAVRNLAVLTGRGLANDIRTLSGRVRDLQIESNQRIEATAKEINHLVEEIAGLNIKIVVTEGGEEAVSDAVGLRDRQLEAINELAQIVEIRATRQPNGSTSVYADGELLVFAGTYNEVEVGHPPGNGVLSPEIRIVESDAKLPATSGRLAGLYSGRDDILGGFAEGLDDLVRTLVFEFNKLHSSGQGLTGFTDVTSVDSVSDVNLALDQVELPHTPVNGSFQVEVRNTQTGLSELHDILVELNGLSSDTNATQLVAAIDAIDGISASLDYGRHLVISSDSPNVEFSFANDSSGVLAALGINTFFQGNSSFNIKINDVLVDDPSKFAASGAGIGAGAQNVELLAEFQNRSLAEHDGDSLAEIYERLVGETSQDAEVARSVAEGFRVFQSTLEGQKLGISGVSIDEEAVKLVELQRVYQASARYISIVSDLLESLINL